jgi:DNA polymerase III epsilon subunit-like protein
MNPSARSAPIPPAPPPSDARVLFLDTETTGLDAGADRVIEVGVVEVKGDVDVGAWSSLVRADQAVPARVTQITGITDAMTAAGIAERDAVVVLAAMFARVDAVVAWNAAFDRAFVAAAFARAGITLPSTPWFCALEAARLRRPDLKGYRLDLVARDLGVATGRSHRALDDARCALHVWRALPSSSPASSPAPASTADAATDAATDAAADAKTKAPSTGPRGTLDLFR